MAKQAGKNLKIFVKVLWGDSELGEVSRKFSSVRSIQIGRSLTADIRSTVWPLREDLDILERDGGRIFLNSGVPWSGIIASGGDVSLLDARVRGKKNLEIRRDSFATVKFESITVAIRVGTERVESKPKWVKAGSFSGSILGLIADTPYEQAGLGVGLVAGLLVMGAMAGGLSSRTTWKPESMSDLRASVRLPFISPTHFATAPDVLQDRLDRFQMIDSVTGYYSDLGAVLTRPLVDHKTKMLFDETVQSYRTAGLEQESRLAQLDASVDRLAKDLTGRGNYVLSMPVVRAESLDGSLQRVLDKIAIVSASAKLLSEKRLKTADIFQADPAYDYGNTAGKTGSDELADFTKKLGDGFRKTLPDEEQQALEAKSMSIDASAIQVALFGRDHLIAGVVNCCDTIVGIKAGSTPVTYHPMPRFTDSDEKLASLKSSIWGAPEEKSKVSRIVEPIAGVIDSKAVERAIASGKFQLQLCFELALRRNQAAKGSMEWSWRIDTRGSISALSLIQTTLKDQELVQCVRTRIAGWRFPKPKGGSVEIRYPFEFVRDKG